MLTADLVRVRDDGKSLTPRYLKLEGKGYDRMIARAENLLELFEAHAGQRKSALDDAIADLVGDGTDHMLTKGLTKLLADRAEFETVSPVPPPDIREAVFRYAAQHHPLVEGGDKVHKSRVEVLQMAADDLGVEVEILADNLYGDLATNQRLTKFKPITPEGLLARYNAALAQSILLRATQLRVTVTGNSPAKHRQLFRYLKFHRLMHRVRRTNDGHELVIDGPASLLNSTSRYGLQMAIFLPALLLCEDWQMEADILWGPERAERRFALSSEAGLRSHYKERGVYITEEQEAFERSFKKLTSDWSCTRRARIVDLGGRDVLVPDLGFTHTDGRKALLEIVGYWRRGWLESKTKLLVEHGPPNLVLAVSDRLCGDDNAALDDLPVTIVPWKGVILAKKILAAIETVAT